MRNWMVLAAVMMSSVMGYAAENIHGDLFTYENKHASFTVIVPASEYTSMSMQIVYSTPTAGNVPFYNTDVDLTNNTIYEAGHTLATGLPVLLATAPATGLNPLTSGTTYFAIKINDNLIQLATTYAQAVSRDPIDILAAPAGSWTLIPTALSLGSAAILFHASNDGTNYSLLSSSVTLSSNVNGSQVFDFGQFAYRLLRLTFNGPSSGAIRLRAYLNARK